MRITRAHHTAPGTREFVEQRLQNVLCLIGVAVRGRAVAGAIGVPFPAGDPSAEPAVLYALVGASAGCFGDARPAARDAHALSPIVATGDSKNGVLAAARKAALERGGSTLLMGGAGAKVRM